MKLDERMYRCTCRLTMDVAPETMRLENDAVVGEALGSGVTFRDRRLEVIRKVGLLINLPQWVKGEQFARSRSIAQQGLKTFYRDAVADVEVFSGTLPGQVELVLNPLPCHGQVSPQCRVITLLPEPLVGCKLRRVELTKPPRHGRSYKHVSVFDGQVTLVTISDAANPVWFNELVVFDSEAFDQLPQVLMIRGTITDCVELQQAMYQLAFDEEAPAQAPVEIVELPVGDQRTASVSRYSAT